MEDDSRITNSPLNQIKFTKKMFELMWDIKREHLVRVAEIYRVEQVQLKETLLKLLEESDLHTGACNVAIDFMLISIKNQENNENLEREIKSQILNCAIYYANGIGASPNNPR